MSANGLITGGIFVASPTTQRSSIRYGNGDETGFPGGLAVYTHGTPPNIVQDLWSYTVGDEVKVVCQGLMVSANQLVLHRILGLDVQALQARLGTVVLDVDGTAIAEFPVNDHPRHLAQLGPNGPNSGIPRLRAWLSQFGFTLTSGQVLTVYFSPYLSDDSEGIRSCVIHSSITGRDASTGTLITSKSYLVPPDRTASQVAFQYTAPANGINITDIDVQAEFGSILNFRDVHLSLNDQTFACLGHFHLDVSHGAPCRLWFPLPGMELYPGDTLAVKGWTQTLNDQVLSCMLVGATVPLGFTRSRSVNR